METRDFCYPSADGKTTIHAMEWLPEGAPRAVVQICHGMTEYISRYSSFAAYLAAHGFHVCGNDQLGHGLSVRTEAGRDYHGYFAVPDGSACLIADIHTLRQRTAARFPDVPYFLLGHSMGSFLVRQYITEYGQGLAGAVILGTGTTPVPLLRTGMLLCRLIALCRGWHHRSTLVDQMAGGSFTKRIHPLRTPKDWLSKDPVHVDRYLADPLCAFIFTVNGYYHMFRVMAEMQLPANIARIPRELPLLLASGTDDPVGSYGQGVRAACLRYKKAGLPDVSLKLYPNDRHELLNETDRETVYADLLKWISQKALLSSPLPSSTGSASPYPHA